MANARNQHLFFTRLNLIRYTSEEWNELKSKCPCPFVLYIVMKIFGHHHVYYLPLKMLTYQWPCETL